VRLARLPALATACLLLLPALARAQAGAGFTLPDDVHLDDVHAGVSGERVVDLYVRTLTRYGEPIEKLRAIDVDVRDEGRKIHPEEILEIEPVGDTIRGITCVLVIDASPTMQGEAFDNARTAAQAFLERLGTYDRVAIVAFAGSAEVVAGFEAARAEARVKLQDLAPDPKPSPTVLYDAAHLGIDLVRKATDLPRRTFVIVFSDGKDGGSTHSLDQVIDFAKGGETRTHILLFTIGYDRFGGEGLATLQSMAKETGGEYFQAGSARNLGAFYTSIWRQVTRSYVIRYPADMDGKMHTLTVAVGGELGTKTVRYPEIRRPLWHYLLPAGLLVLLAAFAWLLLRTRSPGRLVFVSGPLAGDAVPLRAGTTRIGGLADNDVVIADVSISRNHAEIHARGKRVEIQDLHSTNGTLVNGSPVRTSPLQPGDKIRLGSVEVVFER
jgi:VWFA-related protein